MWKQNCLPSDTVHYLKVYRFVSTVYFTFTKIIYLVDYPCTSISRDICVRIFWFLEELNQSSLHHDVHHYSWIHHIFVVLGHLKIGQGGWTPGGLSPCTWGPWCRADTPHESEVNPSSKPTDDLFPFFAIAPSNGSTIPILATLSVRTLKWKMFYFSVIPTYKYWQNKNYSNIQYPIELFW